MYLKNHSPVIKDQTSGASILEDGVVILILVELHTTIEPGKMRTVIKQSKTWKYSGKEKKNIF